MLTLQRRPSEPRFVTNETALVHFWVARRSSPVHDSPCVIRSRGRASLRPLRPVTLPLATSRPSLAILGPLRNVRHVCARLLEAAPCICTAPPAVESFSTLFVAFKPPSRLSHNVQKTGRFSADTMRELSADTPEVSSKHVRFEHVCSQFLHDVFAV